MLLVVISGSLRSAYFATAAALDNRHGPADQDSQPSFSDRGARSGRSRSNRRRHPGRSPPRRSRRETENGRRPATASTEARPRRVFALFTPLRGAISRTMVDSGKHPSYINVALASWRRLCSWYRSSDTHRARALPDRPVRPRLCGKIISPPPTNPILLPFRELLVALRVIMPVWLKRMPALPAVGAQSHKDGAVASASSTVRKNSLQIVRLHHSRSRDQGMWKIANDETAESQP